MQNWQPYYRCMQKAQTHAGGRKQRKWWAHLLPVRALRPRQSGLRLLQPYKGVVEREECHCYSSPRHNWRLQSLLTNRLCSRHGPEVGHRFRSVTPHVQRPQQLLNVQKHPRSYSNPTRRWRFSNRHALWLRQRHTGLSSRSSPYSYFSTFPSVDQPIGFGRAYDDISGWKMLHNFAIFLYSCQKTSQWHIYNSPRNRTPIIDHPEREQEKQRLLTSKSNHQRTYNRVFRDCTYKSTCFLSSKVKTMAPTTSSFESYCHKVCSQGIYTRWFYVHSQHPGHAETKVHQSTSEVHYEALWTCSFRCVRSLL